MSKLEALMLGHLKKQQTARDAHTAKVKVVQDAIERNNKTLRTAAAERNRASDNFHETTKLTGREFIEALDKLHAGIDATTEKTLVVVPDGSGYGAELSEALLALDQAFATERIKIEQEESAAAAALITQLPSAAEEASIAAADTSSDGIFQVLTKIGAKAADLKAVLGVESAVARKADRAAKTKTKTNSGLLSSLRKATGV